MRLLVERPRLVLALALLLTAASLWPATRLAVETDPAALMPLGSEAAADYRVFLDRFGGFEKVFVLVTAGEGADGREAELVAASPEKLASLVASVLGDREELERHALAAYSAARSRTWKASARAISDLLESISDVRVGEAQPAAGAQGA